MGPNEKILHDAYAAYADGRVESLLSIFAENVVIKSVGARNRLDHAGEWHGVDGLKGFLVAIAANWTFQKIDMLEILTQNDRRFVARSAVIGINRHTGARASVERVDLVTMENGKCTSYEEIFDTSPLERASRY
ncbi:MAG: nuclear transport factor 2 family protein [Alphaproteobacteria bacterium]|nr:nuclear transport factor 2 family protein [Alphaproteobacteria bacterium]